MQIKIKSVFDVLKIGFIVTVLGLSAGYVLADWTPPSWQAPECPTPTDTQDDPKYNPCFPPINVSDTLQDKAGSLSIGGGLLVDGQVQFTLGAGAGLVLTSDAEGVASWQPGGGAGFRKSDFYNKTSALTDVVKNGSSYCTGNNNNSTQCVRAFCNAGDLRTGCSGSRSQNNRDTSSDETRNGFVGVSMVEPNGCEAVSDTPYFSPATGDSITRGNESPKVTAYCLKGANLPE